MLLKDNKSVRLEVHHAKTFDAICKENNITTIKGALTCKEIWSVDKEYLGVMDAIKT